MTDTFSVISFNLRFGLADDGPNSWGYRKAGVAEFLQTHRADFIGLQEANDFQVDFVDHELVEYAYIGMRNPAPRFWQNNVLFYNPQWRCISQKHLYLSLTPDIPSRFSESQWPRQCTIGLFEKDQRQLICINTHFDFKPTVQRKSARFVLDQVSLLPSNSSVVLMGDFNATPESDCHMNLTGHETGTAADWPSFENVFVEPYPGTFHGFSGDSIGGCIDWILYRGDIVPDDCVVIRATFNGIYPSDHFPIRAQFHWRGKTEDQSSGMGPISLNTS